MDSSAYNLGRADWAAGRPDVELTASSLDYRAGMADERSGVTDPAMVVMSPDEHLRARVAAGAAWLDEHRPEWVKIVRIDTLDMYSRLHDIIGELSDQSLGPGKRDDSYTRRWNTSFADLLHSDLGEAIRLGLIDTTVCVDLLTAASQGGRQAEYTALTAAWRDEILKRWH